MCGGREHGVVMEEELCPWEGRIVEPAQPRGGSEVEKRSAEVTHTHTHTHWTHASFENCILASKQMNRCTRKDTHSG